MLSKLCYVVIAEWDPWGVPDDYECKIVENDRPIPSHVPHHKPVPLPEEFYKALEAAASVNRVTPNIEKKADPSIEQGATP